jgi:Fe-S-cluster containining protein
MLTRLMSDDPVPSCTDCGACCRDVGDGTALVSDEDLVRWKRDKRSDILDRLVPGHFSQLGLPTHANGTCIYLGQPGLPHHCQIYETRGESCRALEPGSPQCLTFRKLGLGALASERSR